MSEKSLFQQNVIAVIWDFDRTLSPHYMQQPLFEEYGVDPAVFWREVNELPTYYERSGIHVQRDTCYLGHLLSYVRAGIFQGLTNAKLRELGARIRFFPGIPDLFDHLNTILPIYPDLGLSLEHYVVSTGLAEMVRGSAIASRLSGIWASEFIETPAEPNTDLNGTPPSGPISQIAGFLDNTTKTRALFEINKGVNVVAHLSVNDTIPEAERRVPFRNMIYIADGPSDIPSFSVVRRGGGKTFAVYDPTYKDQFAQVDELLHQGRVDAYGPADYRIGAQTCMWIELQVRRIAERIWKERKSVFEKQVGRSPIHLDENETM